MASKWIKEGRTDEMIGGGYFVFRRYTGTHRIKMASTPFEHPTRDSATVQANALAAANPGMQFDVFGPMGTAYVEPEPMADAVQEVVPAE